MNWRKWNAGKQKRSERARKAALTRWERYHAALANEPVREERLRAIVQIVVMQATREPQICLVLVESEKRRNQWIVTEQGERWRKPAGAGTIGRAVARFLALRGRKCE